MRSGIMLIKYWFSVSDEEQERRFQASASRTRRSAGSFSPWTSSPALRWVDYSRAKDEMFAYTDTKQSPWYVVESDDKLAARLNCIRHLLDIIDYEQVSPPVPGRLLERPSGEGYIRPPIGDQTFVPAVYS